MIAQEIKALCKNSCSSYLYGNSDLTWDELSPLFIKSIRCVGGGQQIVHSKDEECIRSWWQW